MQQIRRVCVYCGSSGAVDERYRDSARELGAALAAAGIELVYGGGGIGLMGLLADAALSAGGRVVGIIPGMLHEAELAHPGVGELVIAASMHDRKRLMTERADAFAVLPGGIGTLDELLDTWTTAYLGLHDKPIVLLDPLGHYEGLWLWLCGLLDSGYVSQAAVDRLVLVDKVSAALDACAPG